MADLSNKWGTENVLPMIITGLKEERIFLLKHWEIHTYASEILLP